MNGKFVKNNFNIHKFDNDNILVTTEHGSWTLLSREEYDKLRLNNLLEGSDLYKHLSNRGVLLDENNVKDIVSEMRLKNHFLFRATSLHIIFTTDACNHRCIYCHSEAEKTSSDKKNLDSETGKRIIDFAFNSKNENLKFEFQGGEPLLNFDNMISIVEYANRKAEDTGKNVNFSIVSNLTQLEKSMLPVLKKYDINISTSLDGPKELHDKNRDYLNKSSSFDTVLRKIDLIRDHNIDVNAICTVTRDSLDYHREIIDTYIDLGFGKVWLRPLNKIGYAKEAWEDIGYSAEEFYNFYSKSLDYIFGDKQGEIVEITAYYLSKSILEVADPDMTELTSPCGAGISQLLYNCDGDIYTCDEGKLFDDFCLGNVKKDNWNSIFNNENLLTLIDLSTKKSYMCNNCVWEPFCGICHVNTYSDQNNIVSKLAMDFRCSLNSLQLEDIFKRLLFSKRDRKTIYNWLNKKCASK